MKDSKTVFIFHFCTSLKLFSTYPQKEMELIPNNILHVWRQATAHVGMS